MLRLPAIPVRVARLGFCAFLSAAPTIVLAQAETGTGGGPTSTITAPHTSSVGQTVPRPGGRTGEVQADRTERTPQMKQDDQIQKGICIGCGPK